MPEWVKDEKKWEDAKKAFKKQYNKEPKDSSDWAIVTSIYQKMGGKINHETVHEYIESYFTERSPQFNKELEDKLKQAKSKEEIFTIAKGAQWGVCGIIANAFKRVDSSGDILEIQGNYGRKINANKVDSRSNHIVFVDSNDYVWDPMFEERKVPLDKYLNKRNIIMDGKESYNERLNKLVLQFKEEFENDKTN